VVFRKEITFALFVHAYMDMAAHFSLSLLGEKEREETKKERSHSIALFLRRQQERKIVRKRTREGELR
jgi:hypothetical protein